MERIKSYTVYRKRLAVINLARCRAITSCPERGLSISMGCPPVTSNILHALVAGLFVRHQSPRAQLKTRQLTCSVTVYYIDENEQKFLNETQIDELLRNRGQGRSEGRQCHVLFSSRVSSTTSTSTSVVSRAG